MEEKTKMKKQKSYCDRNGVPMFAPMDGICWSCNMEIPDNGDEHITGCPHCHRSYCG